MDDETKKRWVKGLYQRGIPSPAIAPVLGLSRSKVKRILWGYKLYKRRPWSAEERALVCRLWGVGATLDQIADASGRNRSAVYRVVQSAGLAKLARRPGDEALKEATATFGMIRDRRGA